MGPRPQPERSPMATPWNGLALWGWRLMTFYAAMIPTTFFTPWTISSSQDRPGRMLWIYTYYSSAELVYAVHGRKPEKPQYLGDRLGAKALRRVAQAPRVFTTRSAFSASSAVTVHNLLKRVSVVVR